MVSEAREVLEELDCDPSGMGGWGGGGEWSIVKRSKCITDRACIPLEVEMRNQ